MHIVRVVCHIYTVMLNITLEPLSLIESAYEMYGYSFVHPICTG